MSVQHYLPDVESSLQSRGPESKTNTPLIVIIGAGPVGVRLTNNILKKNPLAHVHLFGNEPYIPYNRVQLTGVLANAVQRDAIDLQMPSPEDYPNFRYSIAAVTSINRYQKKISDTLGEEYSYDTLILAVGSHAYVPTIGGNHLTGVYTFRNLKDTDALYARLASAKTVVVIGGGLLGIEAAKALSGHNTKVILVHQSDRLMNRQLDEQAAYYLNETIGKQGIEVRLGSGVREIEGEARVKAVITRDKERIPCDTVLFCTGIKANLGLALDSGLAFGNGIHVDEKLQTSDPDIYAIGECCEYEGQTYGLVSPGYEQASILAENLLGGDAVYRGSLEVARLKVIGQALTSLGQIDNLPVGPTFREVIYQDKKNKLYRKIVLQKNRIVGALSYGDWEEMPRIQEAFQQKRKIWFWNVLSLRFTGRLWSSGDTNDVKQWPGSAIVCQCNNVDVTSLLNSIDKGSSSLSSLQDDTGAGTVCGSCKPLLMQLVDDAGEPSAEKGWMPAFLFSIIAMILVASITTIPGLEVKESVLIKDWFESIWNDKFYKQVTGFTLLGLSLLGLLMSLRKRFRRFSFGEFFQWRLLHIILGVLCVTLLIFHTGFHMGENLNRLLIMDFLAVVLLGGLTGIVISFSHKLSLGTAKRTRELWGWLHILFSWPLPVLIILHIVTVYYF